MPTTSEKLMEVTRRLLDVHGPDGISLSAIATEANMSRMTLHRNGITVGRLMGDLVGSASADLRESLWPVLTSSAPAADRLSLAIHTLCEVVERHATVLSAVYHQPNRPHPSIQGRTAAFEFAEPFERILIDGNHDRTTGSGSPRDDAEFLINAVTWTYLHMRRSHGWPEDKAREATLTLSRLHVTG